MRRVFIASFCCLLTALISLGQQPRQPGPPPGAPRPVTPRPDGPPRGHWIGPHDANGNGNLETEEFQAATDRTFREFDDNGNGSIEPAETVRPPRPPDMPPPGNGGKRILPPFFFLDRMNDGESLTRAQFDKVVRGVFKEMDANGDGTLTPPESRRMPKRPGAPPPGPGGPPPPPNAHFLSAELSFGDKLVKGQPFSAETITEDTRRLYDGTTVTKERRGSLYRDGAGRTRREQSVDLAGITGEKAMMLVFINDFAAKTQFSLDPVNKIARKHLIGSNEFPIPDKDGPRDAETEQLGTKTIEGITAEGVRITREIPAGKIGNSKPIPVVTERWFSPELQVVVMSRHLDPIAGEHTFKLVNVRRAEPSADLFTVPAGYRIIQPSPPRPDEE